MSSIKTRGYPFSTNIILLCSLFFAYFSTHSSFFILSINIITAFLPKTPDTRPDMADENAKSGRRRLLSQVKVLKSKT